MVENQHTNKVLSSTIYKLIQPFLANMNSHMCFNKKPIGLGSRLRTVCRVN